jgi:hypothetical protein
MLLQNITIIELMFVVEVLNELHRSQESAYNLRDTARQSHINRAKLCSKIIKYPHIEDYVVSKERTHFHIHAS